MIVLKLRQSGSTLAVTVPRVYLRELNWGLGESLCLEIVEQGLLLRAVKPLLPPIKPYRPHPLEAYRAST